MTQRKEQPQDRRGAPRTDMWHHQRQGRRCGNGKTLRRCGARHRLQPSCTTSMRVPMRQKWPQRLRRRPRRSPTNCGASSPQAQLPGALRSTCRQWPRQQRVRLSSMGMTSYGRAMGVRAAGRQAGPATARLARRRVDLMRMHASGSILRGALSSHNCRQPFTLLSGGVSSVSSPKRALVPHHHHFPFGPCRQYCRRHSRPACLHCRRRPAVMPNGAYGANGSLVS